MNVKTTNLKRRGFLVSLGLGGAGAAAGMIGGSALMDKAAPREGKTGPGKGYRLSEHVLNYYRTTRV